MSAMRSWLVRESFVSRRPYSAIGTITTGITSPGAGDELPGLPVGELFAKRNREVRYCAAAAKGFVLLTLNRRAALAELVAVSTGSQRTDDTRTSKRFRVTPDAAGVSGLTEA